MKYFVITFTFCGHLKLHLQQMVWVDKSEWVVDGREGDFSEDGACRRICILGSLNYLIWIFFIVVLMCLIYL